MSQENDESAQNYSESTPAKMPGGITGKGFKPGAEWTGNAGGRPKKRPITEIYEKILADEGNVELITQAVLKNLVGGRMAGVLTLNEMAERVEGKVTQPVEHGGEILLTLSDRIEKARQKLNGDTGE